MNRIEPEKIKCDACRNDTPRQEIRYLLLKTCCSTQRIPLCRECHQKYSLKREDK
jgi:NAD-dependent SIR2 family protein deacetylase